MNIKIEKGVPIPPKGRNRGNIGWTGIILGMGVGDSFYYEEKDPVVLQKVRANIISTARNCLGAGSVATRAELDGIRVWRLK